MKSGKSVYDERTGTTYRNEEGVKNQLPGKRLCRNGFRCSKRNCKYDHEERRVKSGNWTEDREQYDNERRCRYGRFCTRVKCDFAHVNDKNAERTHGNYFQDHVQINVTKDGVNKRNDKSAERTHHFQGHVQNVGKVASNRKNERDEFISWFGNLIKDAKNW